MLILFILGYLFLNFVLVSVIYLLLFYYLFYLMIDISVYVILKDLKDMIKIFVVGLVWLVVCYVVGFILVGL